MHNVAIFYRNFFDNILTLYLNLTESIKYKKYTDAFSDRNFLQNESYKLFSRVFYGFP